MKKLLLIILLSAGTFSPADEIPTKQYEDKYFSITIPDSWDIKPSPVITSCTFKSPKEHSEDHFRENVHVDVEKAPLSMLIYMVRDKKETTKEGGELASETKQKVNGRTTYMRLWVFIAPDGSNICTMILNTKAAGRLYSVTCTAPEDTYPLYHETFGRIFTSLKIK